MAGLGGLGGAGGLGRRWVDPGQVNLVSQKLDTTLQGFGVLHSVVCLPHVDAFMTHDRQDQRFRNAGMDAT